MTSITTRLRGLWSRLAAIGSIGSGHARRSLVDRTRLALWAARKHGIADALVAWNLAPIAGGAPDDDDSDDDSENDDDGGSDDEEDDSDDDDQDDDESDEDDDDHQDEKPLSDKERKEYHRLKREAAERSKKDREARKKQAEESGKWKTLHEETEKERDEAVDRAEKAEAELAAYKRNQKVSKAAKRLKFNDPDDAHHFLPEDAADGSDAEIEKALRDVLKKKPYLASTGSRRKSKAAGGGDDDPPSSGHEIADLDDPKAIREATAKLRK